MQALAERVPRLRVELGPVGEDQVLQAGNPRPGELLVVLLDAPLQLGKEVVQKERGDDCKILKGEVMTTFYGKKIQDMVYICIIKSRG